LCLQRKFHCHETYPNILIETHFFLTFLLNTGQKLLKRIVNTNCYWNWKQNYIFLAALLIKEKNCDTEQFKLNNVLS